MESLPLEVVVEVAQHLTPRDLAMCCAVSPHWRHMFGSDEVWRLRCDPELEEHLRTTPCVVEPAFSLAQGQDSALNPVPRWRAAFLREQHLRRNLQQGNRVELEKAIDDLSFAQLFVSNDHLVCFYCDRIKLWNVRTIPPIKVASTHLHLNIDKTFWVEFDKNKSLIFLTHINFVMVVSVDLTENCIGVKHMFAFDETEKVPENLCAKSKCRKRCALEAYKKAHVPVTDFGMKCCIVATNFLGYNPADGKNVIHIWDSEHGVKLKEEPCPLSEDGFQIFDFSNSESCDDVLVIVTKYTSGEELTREIMTVYYFVYDVKQQNFLKFQESILSVDYFKFYPEGVIVDGYVALFSEEGLQIFNYRTSQKMYTFDKMSTVYTLCSIDDGFLFISNKKLLTVFPKRKIIRKVVDFDVDHASCYGHNIVGIFSVQFGSRELWKVDRLSSLRIDVPYFWMCTNEASTRTCYQNKTPEIKNWYSFYNVENKGLKIIYFW